MHNIRSALLVAIAGLGCDDRVAGAQTERAPAQMQPPAHGAQGRGAKQRARATLDPIGGVVRDIAPQLAVETVGATDTLCVTKGALASSRVEVPTFRAVALGKAGDAAALKLVARGSTTRVRALAGGQQRRQVGIKLRAENGCNVVYVMWRLDPKPKLDVSVKRNPGARSAKQCGAGGYTKVKPVYADSLPMLDDGLAHELRAEILGDSLVAWIDGRVVWEGYLPPSAAELAGPAGIRTDNLAVEVIEFAVDSREGRDVAVKCQLDDAQE